MVLLLFPAIAGCGSNQYASDNIRRTVIADTRHIPARPLSPRKGGTVDMTTMEALKNPRMKG
jgi:hypothetical protein